jgi:hypothetical protein
LQGLQSGFVSGQAEGDFVRQCCRHRLAQGREFVSRWRPSFIRSGGIGTYDKPFFHGALDGEIGAA